MDNKTDSELLAQKIRELEEHQKRLEARFMELYYSLFEVDSDISIEHDKSKS